MKKDQFCLSIGLCGLLFALSLIGCGPTQSAQTQPQYVVSDYDATFEVVANQFNQFNNLHATLFVRYKVTQGAKSGGFKFVGTLPVLNVHVTDGYGNPLEFQIARYDETKITWQFPTIERGTQDIVADFEIENALRQSPENPKIQSIELEWVKNWRVPVEKATYRLVLPPEMKLADWQTIPTHAELVDWHGKNALEVTQSPLQKVPFVVTFQLR